MKDLDSVTRDELIAEAERQLKRLEGGRLSDRQLLWLIEDQPQQISMPLVRHELRMRENERKEKAT